MIEKKVLGVTVIAVLCFFVVAVILVCFGYFLSDDFDILLSVKLASDQGVSALKEPFQTGMFIRPLVMLLWRITYELFALDTRAYYLFHLFLHVINSLLVFNIAKTLLFSSAKALGNDHRTICASLVASLFLIHPIHGSALGWLSNRFDLVCATFYFLSLTFICRQYRSRSYASGVASLFCLVFALLSKEMAIVLPATMTMVIVILNRGIKGIDSRVWVSICIAFIITFVYMILRYKIYSGSVGGYGSHSLNFSVLKLVTHSFRAMINPINYDFIGSKVTILPTLLTTALVGLFVFVVIDSLKKRQWVLFMFLIAMVLSCIPLVNISKVYPNLESSRFYYIPSLFYALFLGGALVRMRLIWSYVFIIFYASLSVTYAVVWSVASGGWAVRASCK